MKKLLLALGICTFLTVAALFVFIGFAFYRTQRADYGWNPAVMQPAFTAEHPRAMFDAGHHNASTAGIAGRYWPFARLLRADGYDVDQNRGRFTRSGLDGIQVLIIANASGRAHPQVFGFNLPVRAEGERTDPAFTAEEIDVVRTWVAEGGSLLFVADHAPFGESAAALATAFGVTMHKGFVEVPDELSDPLLFSSDNGRLGEHPIIRGDGDATALHRIMSYTGQSLDGPADATILLRLPPTAVEWVPVADSLAAQPAGAAQGLAFTWGRGRVIVLGEAAMMTAQVYGAEHFGMNAPDNDNRQFVLNAMHWLSRELN